MASKKVILDTNILFAAYVQEDYFHITARDIIASLEQNQATIILHYGVMLEVATLLSRRYTKEEADTFVHDMLESNDIEIISPDARHDAQNFLSYPDRMAWVDHMLVHLAYSSG